MIRKILTTIFLVGFGVIGADLYAQTSQVTLVNCSADPALAVVDIYVYQAGGLEKVEDVPFQSATTFDQIAIYAGIELRLSVAPQNSSDVGQAFASYTFTPEEFKGYIVIVSGVTTETGYAPNPNGKPILIGMTHREVPLFTGQPNQIGIMLASAATDFEAADVYIRGVTKELTKNLQYPDITTTLSAATRTTVTIDFTKPGDKTKVLASFEANLANYQSETVVMILSGFKTPADNMASNNDLKLLAVLENGSVIANDLIAGSQKARIQWIHNAPDPAVTAMDVWVDGTKSVNDIAFRKATPYSEIAAGAPFVVGFAPATSNNYRDTIKTVQIPSLRPGRTYHLVISGVLDTTKFAKSPSGRDLTLGVHVYEGALEKSDTAGKSAIRTGHQAPDQATISIKSLSTNYGSGLAYSDMTSEYQYIAPRIDTLWLYIDSTGKIDKGYVVDLRGSDKSHLVLASGFVDPSTNQNGPGFKLVLVDAQGVVNASLVEVQFDSSTSVQEDLVPATLWRIAPNPATDKFTLMVPLTAKLMDSYGSILTAVVYTRSGSLLGAYPMEFNGLQSTVTIPTNALATGAYVVHVITAEGVRVGAATVMVAR